MIPRSFSTALLLTGATLASVHAADHRLHEFTTTQLQDQFWSEGASFGDFNRDGVADIVAGPYWYEGPSFETRHAFMPTDSRTSPGGRAPFTLKTDDGDKQVPGFEGALGKNNAYSDNFFAYVHDFNGDGWDDVLILGFPGEASYWHENPKGDDGHWPRHLALDVTDNESPMFTDLTGDGRPEIVCNSKGFLGYAKPDPANPTKPFAWHSISPNKNYHRFTHGLGVGDVNGDGRMDVLEKDGWWEQPASLTGDPVWTFHEHPFSPGGGAQMFAYDVNGDGLNDVITSLAAHGYGLAWYEQVKRDGKIDFVTHTFMNKERNENRYGVAFSQLHAVDLVDMNGDGLKDIITGKRFWAHGPTGDPDPGAPAVIYWFELRRGADGVDFVPHLIHDDSGVGTQVVAKDINDDGFPEIVVGNKKGVFFHAHSVKQVDRETWERAQPKPVEAEASAGVFPKNADGRELNLGFETGTLRDWTATGAAFEKQPVRGDTVAARRGDMRSNHAGDYWIGTYEISGDNATGTLTSAPFEVTLPWAAFRVAGGAYEATRVEVVAADGDRVLFRANGVESEELRPVVVDLKEQLGKRVYLRIVDEQQGGWGHVNFDDFRLHAERPEFDDELTLADMRRQQMPEIDEVKFAGLSAEEAANAAELPPGFEMHVFAAEPDVRQPIAFALDDRGRVWVAEAYDYPVRAPEGEGRDRILVLEDTDGDHTFDKRTVFMEGLNLVSGMEVGFGGVWIGAAPYLMFVPVENWDDPEPAGEPEILLDGWDYLRDTHETLNSFIWGPDGWLYGCHGVFCPSFVGKPGTPDEERQRVDAAVWRYHPTRHEFEVFAEGTSNPWGIDFNEHGHTFIEACVIPHFWHVIQGARYQRQGGQHFAIDLDEKRRARAFLPANAPQYVNPFIYEDIKSHGDHVHYAGDKGPHAGNNRSDAAGGGHAHSGLLVYLSDSWPEEYHGKIFMNNIHGQRLNVDIAARDGSGYVGKHGPDFVNFQDTWSQVLNLRTDPDGSVYLIDWYDANQCHHGRMDGHDRSNGRVFKIVYQDEQKTSVDLARATDPELIRHLGSDSEWHARHALRVLQERADRGTLARATRAQLAAYLESAATGPGAFQSLRGQLRLVWALHRTGGLSESMLTRLSHHESEVMRGWAVQLAAEDREPSGAMLERFAAMAADDDSAMVRLYLASALQRIAPDRRASILKPLVARAADADDHNLPLMYWYAMEPVVGGDITLGMELLEESAIPKLRQFISRRLTTSSLAGAR